jgi:hypothetical protein
VNPVLELSPESCGYVAAYDIRKGFLELSADSRRLLVRRLEDRERKIELFVVVTGKKPNLCVIT